MDRKNYDPRISRLRILAAVCVIWLHTCSTLAENRSLFGLTDSQYVFFGAAFQIMYWAVPVFFMITGALLLGKQTDYPRCLRRYCGRVLLALTVFGIPFAALKIVGETRKVSASLIPQTLLAVLSGESFAHLWYLYVLLGIYLVLPVLQLAVSRMEDGHWRYLLGAMFVLAFLLPTVQALTGVKIAFTIPFAYPLFYVLAGYRLYTNPPKWNPARDVLCILLAGGCMIAAWMAGFSPRVVGGYSSPLTALMALSVFSLAMGLREPGRALWQLDRLCFGAYLIHPLFIHFVYRLLKLTPVSFSVYPLAAVGFFVGFVLCAFAGSWLLNRIPLLRKYVL